MLSPVNSFPYKVVPASTSPVQVEALVYSTSIIRILSSMTLTGLNNFEQRLLCYLQIFVLSVAKVHPRLINQGLGVTRASECLRGALWKLPLYGRPRHFPALEQGEIGDGTRCLLCTSSNFWLRLLPGRVF
jgi:hypothetical protein